jgi:hypothetical protein
MSWKKSVAFILVMLGLMAAFRAVAPAQAQAAAALRVVLSGT